MTETASDSVDTETAQTEFAEGIAYEKAGIGNCMDVQLDGYEGPLDVLLTLARSQKVDLTQISILQLAEQYLDFIREAQNLKLEIAADYLVMASWLAYLKSRLLLPVAPDGEEASPEELAARLVFRLQCLEAMRDCAAKLMARDLLGRDFFPHGMPEGIRIRRESKYDASLYDVLASYSTQRLRNHYQSWTPAQIDVLSIERARTRMESMFGKLDNWQPLGEMALGNMREKEKRRTTMASMFSAALEFARDGRIELQQSSNFEPLLVRRARPKAATQAAASSDTNEDLS